MKHQVLTFVFLALWNLDISVLADVDIKVVNTNVGAEADAPQIVTGNVVYREYPASQTATRSANRLSKCFLLHGHGFDQVVVDRLAAIGGKDISQAPLFAPISSLIEVSGLSISVIDLFAFGYFSHNLIDGLLQERCNSVVVAFQETVQSTIVELAVRLQRLMAQLGCNSNNQCGVIGHSKLGAAVTVLTKQCVEMDPMVDESVCRSIAEVYSASGVNEGIGIAAVVYGTPEEEKIKLASDMIREALNSFPLVREELKKTIKLLVETFNVDFFDSLSRTAKNPMWLDLSPISPMKNGQTLFEYLSDFYPRRHGFFRGDYAASGSSLDFSDRSPGNLISCEWPGEKVKPKMLTTLTKMLNGEQRDVLVDFLHRICSTVGKPMAMIHAEPLRHNFEVGLNHWFEAREIEENTANKMREQYTWENYQISDGIVEISSALGVCRRGVKVPGSAVTACKEFKNLNHMATAGPAPEARRDMIEQFANKKR